MAHAELGQVRAALGLLRDECATLRADLDAEQRAHAGTQEELAAERRELARVKEELEDHKLRLDMMAIAAERARPVLEACEKLDLRKTKGTRPPFAEKWTCHGGGERLVVAVVEWLARRQAHGEGGGS